MAGIAGIFGGSADDVPELVAALGQALVHSRRTVVERGSCGAAGLYRAGGGIDTPADSRAPSPDLFDLEQVDTSLRQVLVGRTGHRLILFARRTFGQWYLRFGMPASADTELR